MFGGCRHYVLAGEVGALLLIFESAERKLYRCGDAEFLMVLLTRT